MSTHFRQSCHFFQKISPLFLLFHSLGFFLPSLRASPPIPKGFSVLYKIFLHFLRSFVQKFVAFCHKTCYPISCSDATNEYPPAEALRILACAMETEGGGVSGEPHFLMSTEGARLLISRISQVKGQSRAAFSPVLPRQRMHSGPFLQSRRPFGPAGSFLFAKKRLPRRPVSPAG